MAEDVEISEENSIADSNITDTSGASDGNQGDQQASEIATELTKEPVVKNEQAAKFLEVIDANEADRALLLQEYPELEKLLGYYNDYVQNHPGKGSVYAINIANEIQEGSLDLRLSDEAFRLNYIKVQQDLLDQRLQIQAADQQLAAFNQGYDRAQQEVLTQQTLMRAAQQEQNAPTSAQESQILREAPVKDVQEEKSGTEIFPDRRDKLYQAINSPGMAKEIAGDDKDVLVALAFYQSIAQGTRGDGLTDSNEQIMLDRVKENLGDMLESNDRASIQNLHQTILQQVVEARKMQEQEQQAEERQL
jgi:hypothetical protein